MSFYDEETIENVRSANDIVDVIGQYVHLTKRGSSYVGLCPFHNEKTPSFNVSADKQMFHCFGCGVGGNVYTFLMKYDNLSFPEAVQSLAERAGITLPERQMTSEERRLADRRTKLLALNKDAAVYFYRALRNHDGEAALEYFKKRALSDETMKNFGLGYSLPYRDDLYKYLKSKGYDDDLIRSSGLCRFDEGYGMHDLFWNRAMFPIMNLNGKVIAFGGRVMGDAKPKYVNSPESPVFDKSRNMYGLNIAKNAKRPYLILCEGYMDVIALHQAGFDNACASLGTSLTEGHCLLLKRYKKPIYLSYDSDGAGVKAARRAIPMLHDVGLETKVIHMDPYKDPDEFMKGLGPEEYEKRVQAAENGFFFLVRKLSEEYDLSDPGAKTSFMKGVAELLLTLNAGMERSNYLTAIAAKYGVREADLNDLLISVATEQSRHRAAIERQKEKAESRRSESPMTNVNHEDRTGPPPSNPEGGEAEPRRIPEGIRQSERMLLSWFAARPAILSVLSPYIGEDDFEEEVFRQVYEELVQEITETGSAVPAKVVNLFDDLEAQSEVGKIFSAGIEDMADPKDREKALRETLIRVKQERIDSLGRGPGAAEQGTFRTLMEEKKKLDALRKLNLGPV